MKKLLLYLTATLLSSTVGLSCSDVLDIDPTDRYSHASIWANPDAVDKYVIGFYAFLKESTEIHDQTMSQFTDAYSDIIKSSSWNQYNHAFNRALLEESFYNSDDAGSLACWEKSDGSGCYNRIRRHNEFLRDASTYMNSLGADFLKPRIAEVRFIRAFAYYRLIRVYGGVVLRTQVDGPKENDKPRATEAESWAQVISDLTAAAEDLPERWEGGRGRVTRAAAYGMLSRVALYAKEWDLAIEAADSCKKAGGKLSADFASVFTDVSNPENLLAVEFLPGTGTSVTHRADTFLRPKGDSEFHGNASCYAAFGPTNKLVDSYEMEDGSEFDWAKHGTDPYSNREPRFYATIIYNDADWEGRKIETFVGGKDGIQSFRDTGTATSTTTGYYLRKFITEDDHTWDVDGSSHFFPLIRYAEVLLNKAEALAEADWNMNKAEALKALNDIRSRGRQELTPLTANNKEDFMKLLHKQRMLELAGEGFRFWDLRRWRLAEKEINGTMAYGMKITRNVTSVDEKGNPLTWTYSYQKVNVDADRPRIFYDRFYAFSIPIKERSNNKTFGENNPGW